MRKDILEFPEQFTFAPRVEHASRLDARRSFLVCGMGGSQFPTALLKTAMPSLNAVSWRDYDLPELRDLRDRLVVISSHSGNTEEAISSFAAARRRRLAVAVMTTGGELLKLARRYEVPHVVIPDTGIQPRMATGLMTRALLALMQDRKSLAATAKLARTLAPAASEKKGRAIAGRLQGSFPLVYASNRNRALARTWKILFNENGRVPAFWNCLPEANHNEMNSLDVADVNRALVDKVHLIMLHDASDHPRIQRRMMVMKQLVKKRGVPVLDVAIPHVEPFEKIFSTLLLGQWASYYTAQGYGTDPHDIFIIEEFKKLI